MSFQKSKIDWTQQPSKERVSVIRGKLDFLSQSEVKITPIPCAPPLFGRSVNPISTRGGKLSPPSITCPPRIFRPCNGPAESGDEGK